MEQKHLLKLTDFSRLELSGVREVTGFDDTQIVLSLGEDVLFVGGQNLKIESFSRESGQIAITGLLDSVFRESNESRTKSQVSFISRLFH